ncbi:hypothetical protein IMG5_152460 [Ichthyophthirius multifiliis]|uniref:WD repeat protein n=1 Tax=Ichthyophthirius multifiliis TaxID=5932 RepID=G0QYV1_ICHMU|nr:hypothetical protein IMG5_152460 [Ichthyophthirius multifiliis]EGR29596.1 hypothetical protein IMG5_152460 [Ichthyophthirius multifiliis]|eukprot:XP_004030832.1 hypothetical protein IMG5_152460 [Ichthyophthirius multifiliis]
MAKFSQLKQYYFFGSWTSNYKALVFINDKKKDFKQITKAFTFSHGASISFVNADNFDQKVTTISQNEKSLKFWNIDFRFDSDQDPKVIKQFKGEQEQKALFDGKSSFATSSAIHNFEEKIFYAVCDGVDVSVFDNQFNQIMICKNAVTEGFFLNKLDFVQVNDSTLYLLSASYTEGRVNVFDLSKLI